MSDLIAVRLKSFGWSLLSFLGVSIAGWLMSTEFSTLVTEHFGSSVIGTLILLFVPEIVKHIRNLRMLGRYGANSHAVVLI